MSSVNHVVGALRVWHIPQVPGKPFYVDVPSVHDGVRVLTVLADYDLFQLDHGIKPDYANMQGLEVFDGEEWSEWDNEDGDNVEVLTRAVRSGSAS